MEKYWMVHRIGSSTQNRHYTKELAEAEARRLASCNIGTIFTVLEVVTAFKVDLPKPTELSVF